MKQPAILVLEDGSVFRGVAAGVTGSTVGEVVFNTAITGYQEILTDPSYARQIVTLTYPHIGNTGVNPEDEESSRVHAAGLVVRELSAASSWRSRMDLTSYLSQHDVVAIAELDTRRLTRLLRDKGALNGCIQAGEGLDEVDALRQARAFPGLQGMDLAKTVCTAKPYEWNEGCWDLERQSFSSPRPLPLRVAAYDYGVKRNILRLLVEHGCEVSVFPATSPAADLLRIQPHGIFLSNGPGDPAACDYAIRAIQALLQHDIPLFGICLGHQLLALACGAQTVKMKFGHHGANHPVQDLNSRKVMISSQNHGFAVEESSLPTSLRATHKSLFDGSLQGIEHIDKPAFGFQGHPEASPGPHDVQPLFARFVHLMQARL